MPEVKLPEATFSWDSILYVIAILVAASGVLVALVKGWEAYRKVSVRDRVKALEGRMDKVEARLSLGDKRFQLQSDDMGHLLTTQQVLLIHFISGNDHDRLRDQLQDLTTYMSDRTTRAIEYANEHEQQMNGGNNQ
jgi:hypothetical protein